jgi:regulator of replication initiation timing
MAERTYLAPVWAPTDREMTEMEALVHTLMEHNAALQREVDRLKANFANQQQEIREIKTLMGVTDPKVWRRRS